MLNLILNRGIKMDILVINDSEIAAHPLEKTLASISQMSCHITTNYDNLSISSILQFLQKNTFHVIFFDYFLKNINGLQLLKHIREQDKYTPVVIISENANVTIVRDLFRAGANDFIAQSECTSSEIITDVIQHCMSKNQMLIRNDRIAFEFEQIHNIVSNMPGMVVYAFDKNSTITMYKGMGLKRVNLTNGELIGGNLLEAYPQFRKDLEKVLQEQLEIYTFESEIPEYKTWFLNCVTYDSSTEGAFGIAIDISLIKAHVQQLKQLNSELKTRNEELDQFVHVASHDLKEPLRQVSSYCDFLVKDLGELISPDVQEDIEYILKGVHRMKQLIESLLMFSRVGKQAMQLQPISLDECIHSALQDLDLRVQEKAANIKKDPLPQVMGDQVLITQLYFNLIGNALKFSETGPLEIHLTVETNGEETIFGVKDNGIGIDPKYTEKIFQPFEQLSRTDEDEGSGVGLSICQKIVEQHDGRIWVESELGHGAWFKFTMNLEKREKYE